MVFMGATVYPPTINLLLQISVHSVKTVSKSFGVTMSGGGPGIATARFIRHGDPVTESSRQRRAAVNDAAYSGLTINGEFLTWTSKPDCANSNLAIAPH